MSDGQPDEAKEWEDFEGPQEYEPDPYEKNFRIIARRTEFGTDVPEYKEWLTTLEHEDLNALRDELLNYVRMLNNERRRRKGYDDDCLCKEKKK